MKKVNRLLTLASCLLMSITLGACEADLEGIITSLLPAAPGETNNSSSTSVEPVSESSSTSEIKEDKYYEVTFDKSDNYTINLDNKTVKEGEKVSFSITVSFPYSLIGVYGNDSGLTPISVTNDDKNNSSTYYFKEEVKSDYVISARVQRFYNQTEVTKEFRELISSFSNYNGKKWSSIFAFSTTYFTSSKIAKAYDLGITEDTNIKELSQTCLWYLKDGTYYSPVLKKNTTGEFEFVSPEDYIDTDATYALYDSTQRLATPITFDIPTSNSNYGITTYLCDEYSKEQLNNNYLIYPSTDKYLRIELSNKSTKKLIDLYLNDELVKPIEGKYIYNIELDYSNVTITTDIIDANAINLKEDFEASMSTLLDDEKAIYWGRVWEYIPNTFVNSSASSIYTNKLSSDVSYKDSNKNVMWYMYEDNYIAPVIKLSTNDEYEFVSGDEYIDKEVTYALFDDTKKMKDNINISLPTNNDSSDFYFYANIKNENDSTEYGYNNNYYLYSSEEKKLKINYYRYNNNIKVIFYANGEKMTLDGQNYVYPLDTNKDIIVTYEIETYDKDTLYGAYNIYEGRRWYEVCWDSSYFTTYSTWEYFKDNEYGITAPVYSYSFIYYKDKESGESLPVVYKTNDEKMVLVNNESYIDASKEYTVWDKKTELVYEAAFYINSNVNYKNLEMYLVEDEKLTNKTEKKLYDSIVYDGKYKYLAIKADFEESSENRILNISSNEVRSIESNGYTLIPIDTQRSNINLYLRSYRNETNLDVFVNEFTGSRWCDVVYDFYYYQTGLNINYLSQFYDKDYFRNNWVYGVFYNANGLGNSAYASEDTLPLIYYDENGNAIFVNEGDCIDSSLEYAIWDSSLENVKNGFSIYKNNNDDNIESIYYCYNDDLSDLVSFDYNTLYDNDKYVVIKLKDGVTTTPILESRIPSYKDGYYYFKMKELSKTPWLELRTIDYTSSLEELIEQYDGKQWYDLAYNSAYYAYGCSLYNLYYQTNNRYSELSSNYYAVWYSKQPSISSWNNTMVPIMKYENGKWSFINSSDTVLKDATYILWSHDIYIDSPDLILNGKVESDENSSYSLKFYSNDTCILYDNVTNTIVDIGTYKKNGNSFDGAMFDILGNPCEIKLNDSYTTNFNSSNGQIYLSGELVEKTITVNVKNDSFDEYETYTISNLGTNLEFYPSEKQEGLYLPYGYVYSNKSYRLEVGTYTYDELIEYVNSSNSMTIYVNYELNVSMYLTNISDGRMETSPASASSLRNYSWSLKQNTTYDNGYFYVKGEVSYIEFDEENNVYTIGLFSQNYDNNKYLVIENIKADDLKDYNIEVGYEIIAGGYLCRYYDYNIGEYTLLTSHGETSPRIVSVTEQTPSIIVNLSSNYASVTFDVEEYKIGDTVTFTINLSEHQNSDYMYYIDYASCNGYSCAISEDNTYTVTLVGSKYEYYFYIYSMQNPVKYLDGKTDGRELDSPTETDAIRSYSWNLQRNKVYENGYFYITSVVGSLSYDSTTEMYSIGLYDINYNNANYVYVRNVSKEQIEKCGVEVGKKIVVGGYICREYVDYNDYGVLTSYNGDNPTIYSCEDIEENVIFDVVSGHATVTADKDSYQRGDTIKFTIEVEEDETGEYSYTLGYVSCNGYSIYPNEEGVYSVNMNYVVCKITINVYTQTSNYSMANNQFGNELTNIKNDAGFSWKNHIKKYSSRYYIMSLDRMYQDGHVSDEAYNKEVDIVWYYSSMYGQYAPIMRYNEDTKKYEFVTENDIISADDSYRLWYPNMKVEIPD